MAMKKGFCVSTVCNKREEVRRIFDVNSETQFCHCPYCGKKYRPKVAIFNYEKRISRYNKKATFFLKNVGQPLLAYNLFAYVLELEPNNKMAKLGRLLSLAYLSTLRRNRFNEVKALLDIAKEDVKDQKGNKYSSFLSSLNTCASDYLDGVRRKLTLHNYFFDTDCLKLYYINLRDVIEFKRYLASELAHTSDKKSAEKVFEEIKTIELLYNEPVYTADGIEHTFTNFTKTGDPLIAEGRKKIETKLDKFRLSTLNKNDKKLIYIKDPVFSHAYIAMYRLFENAFIYTIINLVIAAGFFVTYAVVGDVSFRALFLILGIVFAVFGVSFFTVRIIFGSILKKPR